MSRRGHLLSVVFGVAVFAAGTAQATCFREASQRYGIDEQLLKAIAGAESSGRATAMNYSHRQRTGSYDIGLMQINSSWLPRLAQSGISEQSLLEPCQNLLVGAWILAGSILRYGPTWNAVGAYNAVCRKMSEAECKQVRSTYVSRVQRELRRSTMRTPPSSLPVPMTTPQVLSKVEKASLRVID